MNINSEKINKFNNWPKKIRRNSSTRAKYVAKRVKSMAKNEAKLARTAIKQRKYMDLLKVSDPIHGTVKYGIMGFLIPIPFAQILGMIAGALVGAAPGAKKSIEKLIKTLAKLSKNK